MKRLGRQEACGAFPTYRRATLAHAHSTCVDVEVPLLEHGAGALEALRCERVEDRLVLLRYEHVPGPQLPGRRVGGAVWKRSTDFALPEVVARDVANFEPWRPRRPVLPSISTESRSIRKS